MQAWLMCHPQLCRACFWAEGRKNRPCDQNSNSVLCKAFDAFASFLSRQPQEYFVILFFHTRLSEPSRGESGRYSNSFQPFC